MGNKYYTDVRRYDGLLEVFYKGYKAWWTSAKKKFNFMYRVSAC